MQETGPTTSLDLNAAEVQEISNQHYPWAPAAHPSKIILGCEGCGQAWPCDTHRLIATLKTMRQDRDHLAQILADEQAWAEKCERDRDEARRSREIAEELCERYGIADKLP